jgi:ferredoxin-NADP reductase
VRFRIGSTLKTKLLERSKVADDTLEVSFERPVGFSFKAGQYIQVGLTELLHSDRRGRSRVFSIASSPTDESKLSIAFRETGSGYKRTLDELPIGSPVMIQGPHGFYALPASSSRPIVLVAGGIGITPYLSMLRCALAREGGPDARITLLYANRSKAGAAYLQELENMARRHEHISVRKRFGLIDDAFLRQHVKNVNGHVWHIAGPPAMVDSVRNLLFLQGVDIRRVCYEEFIGY